jgi:hypothetical protein
MPYGRRLTSLAVVVVHPLALLASTLSSSKRRNENVANERDTCGVRAIHPRPEGRGFLRIPITLLLKSRRKTSETAANQRFNLVNLA